MSNNLKISRGIAITIYEEQNEEGKKLLRQMFPGEFEPELITDRVKSFEDACVVLGIKADVILFTNDTKDEAAYKKLKVIVRALNEDWEPDWSDSNQYKYTPCFSYKAGFGFSDANYVSWGTNTYVGSRLVFKTRELAQYAGTQFQSIYNDYLLIS